MKLNKIKFSSNTIILSIIILIFTNISCKKIKTENSYSKTMFAMDTYFEIKFYSTEINNPEEIFNKIFIEVSRIENKFSIYKHNSIVNKINKNKNYEIDEETYNLIKTSIFISSITNGAFDITILPLVQLWNINSQEKSIPSEEKILEYRNYVDYKKIVLEKIDNKYYIKLLPPLKGIDLGGIAKGFTIKKIKEILESYKIRKFIINGGGDIFCSDNKVWKIGIQHPRKPFGEIISVLNLKNVSVCTSGDYERFFIKNNIRYHHILDPKTGYPAKKTFSVTVITKDPTVADGLATGIFIIGNEANILKNISSQIDVFEYIIIDNDKKIFKSNKFANLKIHL